jgi:hypothetical protein
MGIEDFSNSLAGESIGLEESTSFDELAAKLRARGEITGTSKTYSADRLITKIERVRHGHDGLDSITRSYKLREIVEKLLKNDPVYRKYVINRER